MRARAVSGGGLPSERAPVALTRCQARGRRAVALFADLALLALLALAPASLVRADGPLVVRLALENDNLLLGGYSRIAGRDLDGTDMGRTHALALSGRYDVGDMLDVRLGASTRLYTVSADGTQPGYLATVPIHFLELDQIRLGGTLHRRRAPWRVRFGLGLDVANREAVFAIGASGQQRAWHELNRSLGSGVWLFDYRPDGAGVQVGAAADARAGGRTIARLAPWLWLQARGDAGARLGSLPGASWVEMRGGTSVGIGDPRGIRVLLGVAQRAYLWLEQQPGLMARTTIELRLDLEVAALEVAVHRYEGDQNAVYFAYAFANTTMTVALRGRI